MGRQGTNDGNVRKRVLPTTTTVSAGAIRQRLRLRRVAEPPLDSLRGRIVPVLADDGVPLHVEVDDPGNAELTIIFSHGITVNQDFWYYQRRDLDDLGRLVFWDHCGHGRSGRTAPENATVEQLGEDLRAVIDAVAPSGGPVVLVGHSLGGITIMSLSKSHPELFGGRVIGVALIDTSARLAESPLHLSPVLTRTGMPLGVRGAAWLLQHSQGGDTVRRYGRNSPARLLRRVAFNGTDVDLALVRATYRLMQACPTETLCAFIPHLATYDLRTSLGALSRVDTLVVTGAHDRLMPLAHKRSIADAIPGAHLEVLPDAGHMTPMECPDTINTLLRGVAPIQAGDKSHPGIAG
jgi:pimeloyl-ACP methyl ester carboxylesterase